MKDHGPGLGVTADFYLLEMLTRYRTRLPLATFRSVVCILYVFLALILAVLALGTGLLTRSMLTGRPATAFTVLTIFVVVNLYVIGSYLLREVFSERRFVVADSANAPFYRAFDIPAWHVLVVFAGLRTTAYHVALVVVDSVFLAVIGPAVQVPGVGIPSLLALPVAGYVVSLAVSAAVAIGPPGSAFVRLPWLTAGALTFFAVGFTTARLVAEPIVERGLVGAFTADDVATLTARVAVLAPIAGGAGLLLLVLSVRRLVRASFPVRQAARSAGRGRSRSGRMSVLHRELTRSKVYPLVRRNFVSLAAASLLCLGASAARTGLLPLDGFAERFGRMALGAAFVSFIVVTALVFTVVGPTTLAPQFRFEWENLMVSSRRIAVSAGVFYMLPPLLLAGGISLLLLLLTGVFPLGPVALAISVAAAAMLAECTVPPREMADGSSSQGTVSALIVLALGVPTFAALSASSVLFDFLAIAYSLCLLAGGVACLIRRIQGSSSKFAM